MNCPKCNQPSINQNKDDYYKVIYHRCDNSHGWIERLEGARDLSYFENKTVINGCNNLESAACAENYPYGRLKTKMYFFVEFRKGKGWRNVTQSINPKNGVLNKPHAGTYHELPCVVVQDNTTGHYEFVGMPRYNDSGEFQVFYDNIYPQLDDIYKKGFEGWVNANNKHYPEKYFFLW